MTSMSSRRHCVKHGMELNELEWNGMDWIGMEWNGMEWNGINWSVAHYFEINFRNNSSPPNHCNGKTE